MNESNKQSAVKQALFAIKDLRARLDRAERQKKEPIAVIGMACRFPGGANSPEEFWDLLENRTDAVGPIPADRFNVDDYYDPTPRTAGKMYVREGGFITDEIKKFDPQFFNITPREAITMDPQQRLLLEVMWESLENAGILPESLRNSQSSVFVGMMFQDYLQHQIKFGKLDEIDLYTGTGNVASVAAGRLSYVLGLHGPALAVDCACSSSLVTVHLAVQSLRSGESDLSIAGGVNVLLSPEMYVSLAWGGTMSVDARCKTFDESANGYIRGEGCGLIVLKRLSDAQRDGDNILAVIRGSAVNHDGPASGLTVPNGVAQASLLRSALKNADVQPGEVEYLEAHGTGTPQGDPIEVNAIQSVMGKGRSPDRPLTLGSVKTNIGHLETAAGVAGVIKTVLALQNEKIPSNLHFRKINPSITLEDIPARVASEHLDWPASGHRVAGVSSFGLSGTNSHVVIGETPVEEKEPTGVPAQSNEGGAAENAPQYYIVPLTAQTPGALKDLAARYVDFLGEGRPLADATLSEIAYNASFHRSQLPWRLTAAVQSKAELAERLSAFVAGESRLGMHVGQAESGKERKIAFVCSGQGSMFWPFPESFLDEAPVFGEFLRRCDAIHKQNSGWSLIEQMLLGEDESRLLATEYAQPTLVAIQISLFEQWKAYGIVPAAVIGHSMGEVSAAYISGSLSLEDTMMLVHHRSRVMQKIWGQGKMAFVGAAYDRLQEAIRGQEDRLSIAAINSPGDSILSGETEAIMDVLAQIAGESPPANDTMKELAGEGVYSKLLESIDVAGHSPLMDKMLDEYRKEILALKPRASNIPYLSTVEGAFVPGEKLTPDYWCRNVREPVLFSQGLQHMLENHFDVFVEIAPHMPLTNSVKQGIAVSGKSASAFYTLHRKEAKLPVMLGTLGALHGVGCKVDLERYYPQPLKHVRLPNYPWQRSHYWIDEQAEKQFTVSRTSAAGSEIPEPGEFYDNWLYELNWQPVDSVVAPADEAGLVVLFADEGGTAAKLEKSYQNRGQRVAFVRPGTAFERVDTFEYRVRPDSEEDMRAVLSELSEASEQPLRSVVHMWSLDGPANQAITPAGLEESYQSILASVICLTRLMGEFGDGLLWLISRNAVIANSDDATVELAGSLIWGLGRTLSKEAPELWGGLVDLGAGDGDVDALAVETLAPAPDYLIALRGGRRHVARYGSLRAAHPTGPTSQTMSFREDGSYVITGGLGSIGIQLVEWMLQRGARNFVLLGRTRLPERSQWDGEHSEGVRARIDAVRKLEALGASVMVLAVDVADEAQVRSILDEVRAAQWPPVRGLMHAAAVLHSQPIMEFDLEKIPVSVQGKVVGGWLLHEVFREEELDHFVLFSSAASAMEEFSEYAGMYPAANAFLDALAHFRRARGLTALSVNWGSWSESEFSDTADGDGLVRKLGNRGISGFTNAQGMDILDTLMLRDLTQALVSPVNWSRFKQSNLFPRELSAYADLIQAFRDSSASAGDDDISAPGDAPEGLTGETLLAAGPDERLGLLTEYLQLRLAKVMRLSPAEVSVEAPIKAQGTDSMMAVELRNSVQQEISLVIPVVKVLDGSSLNDLAQMLVKKLPAASVAASPGSTTRELPMSENQKGVWVLHSLTPSGSALHISSAFQIFAEVRVDVLNRSIDRLARRHAILRSRFFAREGEPVQIIGDERPSLQTVDAQNWDQLTLNEKLLDEANRPFNLEGEAVVRFTLFSQFKHAHTLLISAHQIGLDQVSLEILVRELLADYSAGVKGENPELAEPENDFEKFVATSAEYLNAESAQAHEKFWRETLKHPLPLFDLDSGALQPPTRQYNGGTVRFDLPENFLSEFSGDQRETENALIGAFALLLGRYAAAGEVILGLEHDLRGTKFADCVGNLSNLVALRIGLNKSASFEKLHSEVGAVRDAAEANANFPFSTLVQRLQAVRYPAKSPVVQVLVRFEDEAPDSDPAGSEISPHGLELPAREVPYEMILTLRLRRGRPGGRLDFREDFSSPEFAGRTVTRLLGLLEAVNSKKKTKLADFEILEEHEFDRIRRSNANQREYELRGLHELFEEQAGLFPGAVAIVRDKQSVRYEELNVAANQFAHHLAKIGVQPGDSVALSITRSVDALIGYLGILKAGAVCVPLDPGYSVARMNALVHDSGAACLVTLQHLKRRFIKSEDGENLKIVLLDEDASKFSRLSKKNPEVEIDAGNTACIFYSDQGGPVPAAVCLSHRALMNAVSHQIEEMKLSVGLKTMINTSISAPVSVQEIFSTLGSGGTLIVSPLIARYNDLLFARWMTETGVDRAFLSPQELEGLAETALEQDLIPAYLRLINVYGERVDLGPNAVELLNRIRSCELFYYFGFAECNIATAYRYSDRNQSGPLRLPIGSPISNLAAHILDENGKQVPFGVSGDLYVEGAGLASAYLNRDDLNAARFGAPGSPAGENKSNSKKKIAKKNSKKTAKAAKAGAEDSRLMHTGFLARYREDGLIELLGRKENRVSLRGTAVNLENIQAALESHPAVSRAIVLKHEHIGGNELLAYIVSDRIVDRLTMLIKCTAESPDGQQDTLITRDISMTGLSLNGVPDHWAEGHEIKITLILPGSSIEIPLTGVVVWKDRKGAAGLRYEKISEPDKSLLKVSLVQMIEMEELSVSQSSESDFRVPLQRRCVLSSDEGQFEFVSEAISNSGLTLQNVPGDWKVGSKARIAIDLPGVDEELELDCFLAWHSDKQTGYNFNLNEEQRETLDAFFQNFGKNQLLSLTHLRFYLKERLPYYLIPSYFVIMDALPQLPDGNVNVKALRFPIREWYRSGKDIVEPRTPVEGVMAQIWEETLGQKVGIYNNFFDLGGDSLMAVKALANINSQFDVSLTLNALWAAPTIADLAALVIQHNAEQEEREELRQAIAELSKEELQDILHKHLAEDRYE